MKAIKYFIIILGIAINTIYYNESYSHCSADKRVKLWNYYVFAHGYIRKLDVNCGCAQVTTAYEPIYNFTHDVNLYCNISNSITNNQVFSTIILQQYQ